jgi:Polyketide cyclase / dehydrase and lipid transport
MRAVRAAMAFPSTVHEAESLWYDTTRWPTWVDGLAHVAKVEGPWPGPGSVVIWDSNPAGRGRVVERVVAHEPLGGQTSEVEDDSIRGRQSVAFAPAEGGVEVELMLAYEIKQRSIVTPLVDLVFIRRAMTMSLASTLRRFGVELEATRDLGLAS